MIKISVIIPTYNRADLLDQTLMSVNQQSKDNWECIIIDDFSTDATPDIVNKFTSKDNRFLYFINERDKGAQGARNTGINKASGDYIMFLDSDDWLSNDCIALRAESAKHYPNYDLLCFRTGVFKTKPGDLPLQWNVLSNHKSDLTRFLMIDPPWHTSGSLWKAGIIEKLGYWDEKIICFQDWDLHCRFLLSKEFSYKKIDEIPLTTFYRMGEKSSISGNFMSKSTVDSKTYLVEKFTILLKTKNLMIEHASSFTYFIRHVCLTVSINDPDLSAQLFRKYSKELCLRTEFSFFYPIYYRNRFNPKIPRIIRKCYDIIPWVMKKLGYINKNSTFLKTTIDN